VNISKGLPVAIDTGWFSKKRMIRAKV